MLVRIGRDGSATIVEMDNRDSLSERRIRKAIGKMNFYVGDFPDGIDCWYRKLFGSMYKRNKIVAKREGKEQRRKEHEEYERRLVADSIEGYYIPRNIEDCFHTLDSTLSYRNRNAIMQRSSRDDMSDYHFGLGMWMRNNWGLWGGSRLQNYCEARGLYHPDDMSSTILRYYYDYLHGQDSVWRVFDTTLVPPPPPDTATVALPEYRVTDRNLRRVMKRVIKGITIDADDEDEDERRERREEAKKKKSYLLTISNMMPDDTLDAEKKERIERLKELEQYLVAMPWGKGKSTDSTFRSDKPFVCLAFEDLQDYYQYCRQPVYGYVSFRGRTFLLTEKEINSGFLKTTGKTRRYWKPSKYYSTYSGGMIVSKYIYSNGVWYCFF